MPASRITTAARARDRLREHAEEGRAEKQAWFFKAGPGGYGEGDRFHGVRVPHVRRIAAECRDLPFDAIRDLLGSAFHEERLLALILLVRRYEHGDEATKQRVFDTYLEHLPHVNNWDLVDASAARIVGAHLSSRERGRLYRLASSAVLWERRIAIVATFAFILAGDFDDTLDLAEQLLDDEEDLIQKAVGWMLREVGKRDIDRLRSFLDRHYHRMPRTMLRYSIERLPSGDRDRYMGKPKASRRRIMTKRIRRHEDIL